ncbi:MAG TPA: hypothetical protein VHQ66_00770 [Myxococcota bacterium]|nr:hypothetical protein [Myxococcota bacterium]
MRFSLTASGLVGLPLHAEVADVRADHMRLGHEPEVNRGELTSEIERL